MTAGCSLRITAVRELWSTLTRTSPNRTLKSCTKVCEERTLLKIEVTKEPCAAE